MGHDDHGRSRRARSTSTACRRATCRVRASARARRTRTTRRRAPAPTADGCSTSRWDSGSRLRCLTADSGLRNLSKRFLRPAPCGESSIRQWIVPLRSSRSAFSAAASPDSCGSESSPTTSDCSPTRPTRSWRPSAFRISCRTCSARARCRRPSFRFMRARRARGTGGGRAGRRRGRGAARARHAVLSCSACLHAAARRAHRAGIPGREARADDRDRPHPLSGRGTAGAVRLVPRRPQQPSPLSASYIAPVIWNVSMIGTLLWWGAVTPSRGSRSCWRGARCRQRAADVVQLPAVLGLVRIFACGSISPTYSRDGAQLRPGLRQPRRRADQRVYRRAAGQPAADRRRHRADERAAALHASRKPVRTVGVGGGTAGDVGRGRQRRDALLAIA